MISRIIRTSPRLLLQLCYLNVCQRSKYLKPSFLPSLINSTTKNIIDVDNKDGPKCVIGLIFLTLTIFIMNTLEIIAFNIIEMLI